MVNDQEPRYRLVDANGNVVGSFFAESDGTLKVQEGTSGNDNELSLTTQGTLNTEQTTVTGETLINVRLSTDRSLTAGSPTTIQFDNVSRDQLGEYDSSTGVINFQSTGTYLVELSVVVSGLSQGDEATVRFQDISLNVPILKTTETAAGGDLSLQIASLGGLNQNSDYEVQVVSTSSATAKGSLSETRLGVSELPQS